MTPDLEPLLRAVLADPNADEPRVDYSIRLAESPHPVDRLHAEFIRVQLELANTPESDSRWAELIGQERELLEVHRGAWEKPLRDLLRPSLASPGRWLRSHLFGSGGLWGFYRGFVEFILAPAPTFLQEDAVILNRSPVRRVVLGHASQLIESLAADSRLQTLTSLHLIGDMEYDEDLVILASCARAAGFIVLEFRLPRLWQDEDAMFQAIRAQDEHNPRDNEAFPAWRQADARGRKRLHKLATTRTLSVHKHEPAWEGELLAVNEWAFLGREFREAGAWAVAKSHHDLEDSQGRCRRLVLLRPGKGEELRNSQYFTGEIS